MTEHLCTIYDCEMAIYYDGVISDKSRVFLLDKKGNKVPARDYICEQVDFDMVQFFTGDYDRSGTGEKEDTSKWGFFRLSTGRAVVEPTYDYAYPFYGDRAKVRKNGKYGFLSCLEVFSAKTRIILDIGAVLPAMAENGPKPVALPKSKDLPQVEGLFQCGKKSIDAVIISHGHEDHVGLLQDIHPDISVFIGEKALDIFHTTAQFTGKSKIPNPTYYLQNGKAFIVGDLIIKPYLVDHSGFDAYAFHIQQGNRSLVYTGDFRVHGRKKKATEHFISHLPKDIDLLLIEGTMMSRRKEKVETEEAIENSAYTFMSSQAGPVFVLQSSTNIDRLVGMYRAAKRSGRFLVMDIFTANIVEGLNDTIPKPGLFKDVRVFYPYYLTQRMFRESEGEYFGVGRVGLIYD